jgi:P63C domain
LLNFSSKLSLLNDSSKQEIAMTDKQSLGGIARANALTPEERSAIARSGALARHGKTLPKAIAEGIVQIGNARLACAVLDDEKNTRVFTQEGFLTAIGRAGKAKGGEGASIDGKAAFLRATNLKPFISDDLIASTRSLEFTPHRGPGYQGKAYGYAASLLPNVCWVYQDAMTAGKLTQKQQHIGEACRALLKALSNKAIEDLVDEATGFGDAKKRDYILKILEKYISPERLPYVQVFDTEFYRIVFRLNGWPFNPEKSARPSVLGHWTNNIYDRTVPGFKGAVHSKVKRNAKGRPTEQMTRYMTDKEGKERLRQVLEGVKAIGRISKDKNDFWEKMDIAYPKFESVPYLPFQGGLPKLPKRD